MTSGSMRYWLRPTLGAVLFIAGAAGIGYKVISSYRHAAPDAFISVQDQNKMPAASVANSPAEAPAVSASVAAPPLAPRDAVQAASSVAVDADTADTQNDSACVAIKTEKQEIEGALKKKYSSEEGRYMQRRLRELTEQSVNQKCGD
jgi:hypothetical protein